MVIPFHRFAKDNKNLVSIQMTMRNQKLKMTINKKLKVPYVIFVKVRRTISLEGRDYQPFL